MPKTTPPAKAAIETTATAAVTPAAVPASVYRIEPDPEGRELTPPCGGNWMREADGGLLPRDANTAAAAGLGWAEDTAG